jgi:hypothetical protein
MQAVDLKAQRDALASLLPQPGEKEESKEKEAKKDNAHVVQPTKEEGVHIAGTTRNGSSERKLGEEKVRWLISRIYRGG